LLVILDEPTSALDAETEHALFERFAELSRDADGRITVLISHRFATVRMADTIVVLSGHGIAEAGTHEELMHLDTIQASSYS
jgi:ATP-binding cassette, subfamily B, bacterial